MDIIKFRDIVISNLYNYISKPVISIPSVNPVPPYPFITYAILNSYVKDDNGHIVRLDDIDTYIIERKVSQIQFVISFTVYGKDSFEVKHIAKQCRDYFEFIGTIHLNTDEIVVVDSTDIENRDILDVDEYERREGFDVTFRVSDIVDRRIETIDNYSIVERID